jgi:hypothetical protein
VNAPQRDKTPKPRLIFEFDPETGGVSWRQETNNFPLPILINALEMAKHVYMGQQVGAMMAQQQQRVQKSIVLPDGSLPPS